MDNGWENILLHEVDPNIKLYHSNPGKPNQKALVERMIRDLILDNDLSNSVCFDHLDEANIKAIIESDCFCKIVGEFNLLNIIDLRKLWIKLKKEVSNDENIF